MSLCYAAKNCPKKDLGFLELLYLLPKIVRSCAISASFVKKCNRNDPLVGRCILDRAHKLKPYISNGKSVPELNLPSLDPLFIPVVNVHTGTNNFNASFENILVHGAIDFELKDVVLDLKKNTMMVDLVIPRLLVNLRYVFRGEMMIVKLNAVGPGTIETSQGP